VIRLALAIAVALGVIWLADHEEWRSTARDARAAGERTFERADELIRAVASEAASAAAELPAAVDAAVDAAVTEPPAAPEPAPVVSAPDPARREDVPVERAAPPVTPVADEGLAEARAPDLENAASGTKFTREEAARVRERLDRVMALASGRGS
jgi:hypothetical protein